MEEHGVPKTTLTRSQVDAFSQQHLPTFRQFLDLARKTGKIVIFDLREPPVGHVHHRMYINLTLKSIAAAGVQHDKVRVRGGARKKKSRKVEGI